LNVRQSFILKFAAEKCEVVLNLYMKGWMGPCHTGLLWTSPCRAKSRPALPNSHT